MAPEGGWAQSPMAKMRWSAVAAASSTRMPRSQGSPAEAARAALAMVPVATTRRSDSTTSPSVRRMPLSRPSATIAACAPTPILGWMPTSGMALASTLLAEPSSLALHEGIGRVDDRHGAPALGEPAGGLDPEDAGAEHDGPSGVERGGDDLAGVVDAA